jgi:hypothetical protein
MRRFIHLTTISVEQPSRTPVPFISIPTVTSCRVPLLGWSLTYPSPDVSPARKPRRVGNENLLLASLYSEYEPLEGREDLADVRKIATRCHLWWWFHGAYLPTSRSVSKKRKNDHHLIFVLFYILSYSLLLRGWGCMGKN